MPLPDLSPAIRSAVAADVAEILYRVDAEIAAFNPRCEASGGCCRFEEYGHRLYLTLAELIHFAWIMANESAQKFSVVSSDSLSRGHVISLSLPQFFSAAKPEGCPYQMEHLCHARSARPLGCRVYFCDKNAQSWQNTLYERYHEELKTIHTRWNIDYSYMEWREGLALALQSGWLE